MPSVTVSKISSWQCIQEMWSREERVNISPNVLPQWNKLYSDNGRVTLWDLLRAKVPSGGLYVSVCGLGWPQGVGSEIWWCDKSPGWRLLTLQSDITSSGQSLSHCTESLQRLYTASDFHSHSHSENHHMLFCSNIICIYNNVQISIDRDESVDKSTIVFIALLY